MEGESAWVYVAARMVFTELEEALTEETRLTVYPSDLSSQSLSRCHESHRKMLG